MGVRHAHTFRDLEAFEKAIPDILAADYYSLVVLDVERSAEPQKHPSPSVHPIEMAYRFARHIEETEGIKVLG